MDLIERTFQREGSLHIACNDRNAFFTSDAVRNDNLWPCQKVCEALTFLLDNNYIRFGSKLYRQIVGIPMGTNCAPLVADLFLFWFERDAFIISLIMGVVFEGPDVLLTPVGKYSLLKFVYRTRFI